MKTGNDRITGSLCALCCETLFGLAVLYQGVGCSVLSFFLSNVAIARIGVNRTASFIGVSTVVSIAAGALLLGERFTAGQLAGAAMILAGVYIANAGAACSSTRRSSGLSGGSD